MTEMDLVTVRSLWGNVWFEYAVSDARGLSGGILAIWDPNIFSRKRVIVDTHFVAVEAVWIPRNINVTIITVYAPQDLASKRRLWDSLIQLVVDS